MQKFPPNTYVVGGAVRDTLLNLPISDIDYVVVGSTAKQMEDMGYQLVGNSFPVFLKDGCEYALARTEQKTAVGYKGFEVAFDTSVTLSDDLKRRDLTINSMAVHTDNWEYFVSSKDQSCVIDPYKGIKDLQSGLLKHTSNSFNEDPVRVLRVARFAARYNFTVDATTLQLMSSITHELAHVSQDRIWAEVFKGLHEARPASMFRILRSVGALSPQSAMAAYDMADIRQLDRISQSVPTYVRVLLVCMLFNDAEFSYHKIPTEFSKFCKLYYSCENLIYSYNILHSREKVDLFTAMRAYSDSTILEKMLQTVCWRNKLSGFNCDMSWINDIRVDFQTTKSVDLSAIEKLGLPNIKESVRILRAGRLP